MRKIRLFLFAIKHWVLFAHYQVRSESEYAKPYDEKLARVHEILGDEAAQLLDEI